MDRSGIIGSLFAIAVYEGESRVDKYEDCSCDGD